MNNGKIILDNGGGITLQLGEFAHSYDSAKQAAGDLAAWLADADTSGYDGHDEDAAALAPTSEDVRNGGYVVVRLDREVDTLDTLLAEVAAAANGWDNGERLATAIHALVAP